MEKIPKVDLNVKEDIMPPSFRKVHVSIILYEHAGVQYKVSVIWPPHST